MLGLIKSNYCIKYQIKPCKNIMMGYKQLLTLADKNIEGMIVSFIQPAGEPGELLWCVGLGPRAVRLTPLVYRLGVNNPVIFLLKLKLCYAGLLVTVCKHVQQLR